MSTGNSTPRRFKLVRHEDNTGVSGEGVVVHGVEFHDGAVVMMWHNEDNDRLAEIPNGLAIKPAPNGIEAVKEVHGHDGKTKLVWIDPDKPEKKLVLNEESQQATREELKELLENPEFESSNITVRKE